MAGKVQCSSIWIVGMLILAMSMNVASDDQFNCVNAITQLMPCEPYLLGAGDSVTVPCCQGAQALSQLVGTNTDEMKAACKCFKQAAASLGVNVDRAKQLPQLCQVSAPVPIDPNVDCDSI